MEDKDFQHSIKFLNLSEEFFTLVNSTQHTKIEEPKRRAQSEIPDMWIMKAQENL